MNMRQDQQLTRRRFVILHHVLPDNAEVPSHWDLLIESGSRLAAWRLSDPLRQASGQIVVRLYDHRRAYLDYEGPISHDRGDVRQIDSGTMEVIHWNELLVDGSLFGRGLRGRIRLQHDQGDSWIMDFQPAAAEPARPTDSAQVE